MLSKYGGCLLETMAGVFLHLSAAVGVAWILESNYTVKSMNMVCFLPICIHIAILKLLNVVLSGSNAFSGVKDCITCICDALSDFVFWYDVRLLAPRTCPKWSILSQSFSNCVRRTIAQCCFFKRNWKRNSNEADDHGAAVLQRRHC